MTIQQKLAEEVKHCEMCLSKILFNNRRKKEYLNRKFCSNKCFLTNLKVNGNKHTSSHRLSKSRQWTIHSNIKNRCDNKSADSYERYGGRGITYCKKWKTFNGFWEDMKDGYSDNLTIERINNNGNYCKENCRWATVKEQCNNKSTNTVLSFNGETKTISEWAEVIGVKRGTLSWRYHQGWEVNKILDKNVCKKQYKNR